MSLVLVADLPSEKVTSHTPALVAGSLVIVPVKYAFHGALKVVTHRGADPQFNPAGERNKGFQNPPLTEEGNGLVK